MSETYRDCEVTDESSDRLIILFSLIVTRRVARDVFAKYPELIDRIDDLIEEFRRPHGDGEPQDSQDGQDGEQGVYVEEWGDPDFDRDSFAQAPRK
jgi:hypothetical protein